MSSQFNLEYGSPAVHTHLTIMQSAIKWMAENSRSCKLWCVTLVAAVLVLVARTGKSEHALIALAPTALLYVLDAYYLAIERGFRESYNNFVEDVHAGQPAYASEIYIVERHGSIAKGTLWAMFRSFSVLPFYLMVVITIILAWTLVL